jgi:IS30 family transposase
MKKRTTFRHLKDRDRDRIQALKESGHTQEEIGQVLRVTKGTISRELKRNPTQVGRYVADRAHLDAQEKRLHSKRSGMKIEAHPELRMHIVDQLKKLRSPDEIAGRLKRNGITPRVGTTAIYTWLYSAGQPYCRYLCTRRPRKRRQHRLSKRVLIPDRISIRERPESPHLIHAEGDLFVSPTRLHEKTCGLVVVEKSSKLLTGSLVQNKTTLVIVPAVRHITSSISIDDLTLDNGIENIHHREFGVDAYFCDRGAPYQKPDVEGSIGLIRRWFLPKGTNLGLLANHTFQSQLHLLNHKYRKSLGYRSAYEVALERGIIKRVPRISLKEAVAFR